ncbi:hypothetical protein RhiirA5_418921 [Rhizophagus irregularis]|uniref:Uncharacterized protein n=4 Tax=Rhizophagus irregularis TaxID=588596 RepID=A0A2N0PJA6_9GLOM|nr:hypothetical protein GLOIN_2v1767474 [Rhizophagus irregularis DAOM 181602=DAOM 197198]EXX62162.1 hypothetical protein RirG_164390 [Rhizophagus irregularis DAOM 197198w]PKC06919.1 hypothetical protein RhiirA5_418921 [Rhizophagus irregularis]POG77646.1 hypothetical protein GLOIN_2v1767474 [Rhizophagus irregularis DAOM 181602=DAOM 197198]UZO26970.1 hypothetical protein OCT59_019180 [Rhizophagus irregularis]CAB4485949.1 unnamed protein product [Rhizophagus irregularis]|eukprot:XP_025184512.1 hypothetical protein GLOIN_2v1767474 [Rhizophagus irregularis DAOM 181602=DAOM 197198]
MSISEENLNNRIGLSRKNVDTNKIAQHNFKKETKEFNLLKRKEINEQSYKISKSIEFNIDKLKNIFKHTKSAKQECSDGKDYKKTSGMFKKLSKKGNTDEISRVVYEYDNRIETNVNKHTAFKLYQKSENFKRSADTSNLINNSTLVKNLFQFFISNINFPITKAMINSIEPINNNQQIIQQLKLNHGLLLNGYNVQPSSQAIFKEDGELKVKLYNRQPIVYADISFLLDNLFIDKDNYDNTLQPSNMCINFPIAEITYKGELLKSFSECMNDNNANSHTLYGRFYARKVLIGNKLFIKDLNLATPAQIDVLKFCLFCIYNSAKYSMEIPFNNLFTLNLLPKIVTLDGEELNTYEKLYKWMNSLYQDKEKSGFIISYYSLIPISHLEKIMSSTDDFLDEKQPEVTNFKEILNLEEWIGDAVSDNLASWTRDFQLFQGLVFNQNCEMKISKKTAINFIKIPVVNTSNKSYMKLIKPSTKLEASLISNDVFSLDSLSFLSHIKSNNECYGNYLHILIKCEQYEILLNKDNVRPTKEFEHIIEEALNSMMPLKVLQDIFNKYGHLFPQRIILGRSLKNILPTLSSSKFETIVSDPKSFKLHIDELNISYFLTPNGKIIEINDLLNWIQNPSNLEIIEFDNIIPLYKILEEQQQKKIDDLLQNNHRILMTGVTDLKDLNNSDVEYYKRINIELSLEDDNYKVFGSIISKDNSKLEGIYVNFGSYDLNGFFAMIKKLEKTNVDIKECHILWMFVGKPSELLAFSPSNREFQVNCIKKSIISQPNNLNYLIKTSFSLSQGYTIFVHACNQLANYEPNYVIKLIEWSHNYIIFQIIKSIYNESNDIPLTDFDEVINLDLHICVLCSYYKDLKIDNKKEEFILNSIGYILTKDNFNSRNQLSQ